MIILIKRFIIRLLIWLLISVPMEILGWILLILYLPIHFETNEIKLPYCLRWFDNADLYLNRDASTYLTVFQSGLLNTYLWLAFRNPCNYFGYKILGFQSKNTIEKINIGNTNNQWPGFYKLKLYNYYEYCWIHKWSDKKCLRIRFGWKLNSTKINDWVEQVFVVQPYIDYSGN